ncbi:hypothetical protein LSS_12834 [Leptospira santarosai serovar Shermani str. LT 821]|uniref:Uncharacterized protein n=1 Tax=Leptospira santarosai serovar Shermani str. LT 821 TaxID=758847 RepID=K8Y6W3_9LEPT|nr:hypothetical protein LSS_12834 [Leptospira santarosai serovar Shermani str. LT 821]
MIHYLWHWISFGIFLGLRILSMPRPRFHSGLEQRLEKDQ